MAQSIHDFDDDPRNADILISVNGELKHRNDAVVSVFDSGFVLGDGVWEGLRVQGGHPVFLDAHLDRLYGGAKAIALDIGVDRRALTQAVYATLAANAMSAPGRPKRELLPLGGTARSAKGAPSNDGVHVRLMVTRGVKRSPYQDPRATLGRATIVVIAEWKSPRATLAAKGLALFTVHVRRGAPDVQDPKLNSHSKLNCIAACIQANVAGADEALMLDPHGFVATCNSTHFFIVRKGEVWTSTGDYCLGGITRANVLELCRENDIVARERNFSLTDVYGADEAFVTGTFAGIVPVSTIDGRRISDGRGPMVERLQELYADLIDRDVAASEERG